MRRNMLKILLPNKKVFILFILVLSHAFSVFAQRNNQQQYQPSVKRILFLFDASGSMRDGWEGSDRFEIAKKLLFKLIDSMERANPTEMEFALRVYGHQYPKSVHNCKDSKLEVPFAKRNAIKIKNVLNNINPQGWTPIAYSLFEATRDFPENINAQNAIVLITDGLESCDGDPCAIAIQLQKKRITMKPFIIGLGLDMENKSMFDCVGTYFDANNAQTFSNVLNVVVSQATNKTTAQVNLLDQYGKPTESNVEMTFYDAYSGEIRYNFMHTMNEQDEPSLLQIDPVGKYNLVIHTIPPVSKTNIELAPGKHNIIAVDVPQGELNLAIKGDIGFSKIQCILRNHKNNDIIYVQDFNTQKKYIAGKYNIEILSLPRIYKNNIILSQSKPYDLIIPKEGTLAINAREVGVASIYVVLNDKMKKIYEFDQLGISKQNVKLQPGEYKVVYRPNKARMSQLTETRTIDIIAGQTKLLQF